MAGPGEGLFCSTKDLEKDNWTVDESGRVCRVVHVEPSVVVEGDRAGEPILGYSDITVWYPDTDETTTLMDEDSAMWVLYRDDQVERLIR
jgi:hypothetical protein